MIKDNSKDIQDGDTYIALKGQYFDGHDFVNEAIENGANRVIVEHGEYDVETVIVDDTREYLINYLKAIVPDIKIIGVTGTNGKTTTCFLIYQMLNELGCKCSYIGTLGFYVDDKVCDLKNTTPGLLELYHLLDYSEKQDCKYVVMEASSQALEQRRCDFINFDYAIFTNLTQDHLDYHKTMEAYLACKRHLFDLLKDDGISILNVDDISYLKLLTKNYVTYGKQNSNYKIKLDNYFYVNDKRYEMQLVGNYNLYNMTAAISLLYEMGYDYELIYKAVKKCKAPSGRMEVIPYNDNKIIIDYAHTPDAVEKIIEASSDLKPNRIITIIGCGGDRDKAKRPIMGNIATNKSDYVIFTSDNPRSEPIDQIINDMIAGVDKLNYEIESNREFAIKKGIQLLDKNDILLVLGKGHEKYQIINNERTFFDDKKVVEEKIYRR